MRIATHRAVRVGFTLVELLVAMGLIVLIASLALAVIPHMNANNAVLKAADQTSTWLVTSRNRALRDHAARGVRLIPDPNNNTVVRQLDFIEQPDPFRPVDLAGNPVTLTIPPQSMMNPGNIATITNFADATGTAIRPFDLLEINASGYRHIYQIVSYDATKQIIAVSQIFSEIQNGTGQQFTTLNYRIIRRWRPLVGETLLELPKGMMIDLNQSQLTSIGLAINPDTGAQTERIILFAPSGGVAETTGGKIVLWVCEENGNGEPVLLTIYSRTGAVAEHPPGPPSDLYLYTRDGKGSGL